MPNGYFIPYSDSVRSTLYIGGKPPTSMYMLFYQINIIFEHNDRFWTLGSEQQAKPNGQLRDRGQQR